jgi:hypothetical protein
MFDMGRSVSLKATVTDYLWANPHVMIYAGAKDNKGAVQKWTIELRTQKKSDRSDQGGLEQGHQ